MHYFSRKTLVIQGNHNIVYIMMEGILGPAARYSEIKLGKGH